MRTAYLCADPGVPVFGRKGCSLHVQEMLRALRGLGGQVSLFAASSGGEPASDLADVPVTLLPSARQADEAQREQALLAANLDLASALASALAAGGRFDLVYERYSLWSHAGLEYGRAAGMPTVLEVNAPLIEEQRRYRQLYDTEAALRSARRAFAAADVLVAVSQGVADYLETFPEARGRIHVIANGVDVTRFGKRSPAQNQTGFTVGFVGTLKPWHGVDVLLQAFARFHAQTPESRLLIVGYGPEHPNLVAQATQLGIRAAVEFTGAVDPGQIPALLVRMDVGVAPYPEVADFYFSPLKVYEYMAAELPVVASQIGQLDELIVDGDDGLLCPPGDAEALCAAFARLHAEPELGRRLGRRAGAKVRAEHTWTAVAARIVDLAQVQTGGPVEAPRRAAGAR